MLLHLTIKEKKAIIIHVHHLKQDHIQNNACSYECMSYFTYLTTSQHLRINAWSYHMHVHGKAAKLEDKTLI